MIWNNIRNWKLQMQHQSKNQILPSEFSDEAFKVVDEFIRKTIDLDYEIVIFCDYVTGETLKCKIGSENNVEIDYTDDEFNGHHVASIHNHTKDMYTPPSDKNFGIFSREWENYELIAANNCLWILKGKYVDLNLVKELRKKSMMLFTSSHHYCSRKYKNTEEINEKCDELYGKRLSKYINNKNINDIQLTKRRHYNICK